MIHYIIFLRFIPSYTNPVLASSSGFCPLSVGQLLKDENLVAKTAYWGYSGFAMLIPRGSSVATAELPAVADIKGG